MMGLFGALSLCEISISSGEIDTFKVSPSFMTTSSVVEYRFSGTPWISSAFFRVYCSKSSSPSLSLILLCYVSRQRQGLVTTHWLVGKEGFDKVLPESPLDGGELTMFETLDVYYAS